MVKKHVIILRATVLQNVKVVETLVFSFRGSMLKEQFLLTDCSGRENCVDFHYRNYLTALQRQTVTEFLYSESNMQLK